MLIIEIYNNNYQVINRVDISCRILGGLMLLKRTDFLARQVFDFDKRLLLLIPLFFTEQFLETFESGDPDFLGSLSAKNLGI